MLQQDDSLAIQNEAAETFVPVAHVHRQLTPAQILKRLPDDATPFQQDSAIQANIKVAEINWSQQPDTLHLPGQKPGKSIKDFSLPQYYKDNYFANDSLYHPELNGGRLGVAGDPVPYTIASDDIITTILLGCFILTMVVFARSGRFIATQVKNLFYRPTASTDTTETTGELRFQIFLIAQTSLLLGLLYFFYVQTYVTPSLLITQYQAMGIFVGTIVAYFLVKMIAYAVVNWVFFPRKKNLQWMQSLLFLEAMEGVLIFPFALLQAYFNMSVHTVMIASLFILACFKLLTLYRSFSIFFNTKGGGLQIILYFCALELMPLAALWGVLTTIVSSLKINY